MFVLMLFFLFLIVQRCINAMNKSWHPNHFFCALCGKLFDEDNLNFFEKDGKAYCKEDYFDNFAVTCKRCAKAIMSGYLSAVGSYWHPNCFSCKVCLWCATTRFHLHMLTIHVSLFCNSLAPSPSPR